MEKVNRRTLPRHVDGRLMLLRMPIKIFLIWLVATGMIILFTVVLYQQHKEPLLFLGATLIIGILMMLMSEANNKETGWDILKANIRYKLEGNQYWERGNVRNGEKTRFIWNQINKQDGEENKQKTDF